jgi:hypothetical protein
MSLINDALKRASQSEKSRPRDAETHTAMQPARETRRSVVPMLAGVAVVLLLTAAGWMIWHSLSHGANPAPPVVSTKAAAPAVVTQPPAKVESAPVPAPAPPPLPVVVASAPKTNPPEPPPAPVEVPAPAPQPAPVPANAGQPFPELKLGGIFYNRSNPRATINGQIHGENDRIGDVRVVKITQNKVTVEWNGQTKDLNLE